MEKKAIPLYFQNFDGSHCLQCSLRGILEYFQPERVWTWEELDALSGKKPDKSTWHMSFLGQVGKLGYDVVCVEGFDLAKFVANPDGYLRETMSAEGYAYTMANIDFELEVNASKTLLEAEKRGEAKLLYRNHTADDVRAFLREGYMLIHWVNSRMMSGREGHMGHFVLVYAMDGDNAVRLHDNGGLYQKQPTGRAEWKVDIDFLVRCGTSNKETGQTGGLYALKPKVTKK